MSVRHQFQRLPRFVNFLGLDLTQPGGAIDLCLVQNAAVEEIRLRQVVIILIAAGLIAYDLFVLNGYYLRFVMAEASSIWNAIESFFRGLF